MVSGGPPSDADRSTSARDALEAYWRIYEAHRGALMREVVAAADERADWQPVLRQLGHETIAQLEPRWRAIQRSAIVEDRWDVLVDEMHAYGLWCAGAEVSFPSCLVVITTFREAVRRQIIQTLEADLAHGLGAATGATSGMNRILDLALAAVGDGYFAAKERRIRDSEDRYRKMFDQNPLPMWMFDRETLRFIVVNDAAVRHYGYRRDEFEAMTIAEIRPPEEVPSLLDDVQTTGGPTRRMWQHRKKDGSLIDVEIEASDLTVAGRMVRLVLANDVTERERAQQALRQTEAQLLQAQKMEAVGRLAGGVAHDFNNMLTVVESYATLVEDGFAPGDQRRDDVAEIRRATERAAAITRQLLSLSRHRQVVPRSIDLNEVVAGLVPMLRRVIPSPIEIVTHQAELPPVVADPGQMEQVLLNLALNARDAMPDGGRLTIETGAVEVTVGDLAPGRPPGHYVVLSVTDTGTGMDVDTQRRIFDPFFTTKEVGKGTGLGLAIIDGFVAQAGGTIAVRSEFGYGTTFRVYLPISAEAVVTTVAEAARAPRELPSITVLIVDDDREVGAVAARVLRDAGCRVLLAATAAEATNLCVRHDGAIDVIVLDVILPDRRGDRLLEQLRTLRPGSPVVLTSGYPAGALATSSTALPDLLPKPYSPATLRAAVARAAGLRTDPDGRTEAPHRPGDGSRPRVLVADDDLEFRPAVARVLRAAGCDVIEAISGADAIAQLEAGRVEAILSNLHMPGGGGLDILRAVRRIDLDVPVILMSAMPDVASAVQAVEYGAFRYLTKPLDFDTLGAVVHQAVRAHALACIRRRAT
jgi:two-component system cell cycle sensor histidine kinase/response regulator CckA